MKASKKIVTVVAAASLCLGAVALSGCSNGTSSASSSSNASASEEAELDDEPEYREFSADELMSGKHHAVIQVEGYDPITVELDADAAPQTVTNFAELANDNYYDGMHFYRIVENFCLQGGTVGNNAAGNDTTIREIQGEFSGNGVENPLAEEFGKGTVAMARTSLPNSATSTFFITLGDNSQVGASLDGRYAAFGTISPEDMAIVDKIVADYAANVDEPQMGAITDESQQPIIESISIID